MLGDEPEWAESRTRLFRNVLVMGTNHDGFDWSKNTIKRWAASSVGGANCRYAGAAGEHTSDDVEEITPACEGRRERSGVALVPRTACRGQRSDHSSRGLQPSVGPRAPSRTSLTLCASVLG